MSEKTYVFEPSTGQMDAATAALLSNRNNGGLFGSNGLEGLIGLIIAAGIFGGGNGNGWFGGGGNNNAEREMERRGDKWYWVSTLTVEELNSIPDDDDGKITKLHLMVQFTKK